MDKHELQKRLKTFSHRCAKLAEVLPKNVIGKYFQNQLVRSAFSASANYRAACIAQSRAAFIAKLSISFEEIDEASFWLENIIELGILKKERIQLLYEESIELSKILASSRKNSQLPKVLAE